MTIKVKSAPELNVGGDYLDDSLTRLDDLPGDDEEEEEEEEEPSHDEHHLAPIALYTFKYPKHNIILCGAPRRTVLETTPDDDWLILNCAGEFKAYSKPVVLTGMMVPPESLELNHCIPTVTLNWEDFSLPVMKLSFWTDFYRTFIENSNRSRKIIVTCMGGHGRTGTALAAILLASRKFTGYRKTIDFVRSNYCEEAIETEDQELYLKNLSNYFKHK